MRAPYESPTATSAGESRSTPATGRLAAAFNNMEESLVDARRTVEARTEELAMALRHLEEELDRHRQTVEERQKLHSLLQAVIDPSPALTFIKDRDGIWILANQTIAEIFGLTAQQKGGESEGGEQVRPAQMDRANPERVGRARVHDGREQAEREGDHHDRRPSALHRLDFACRRSLAPPASLAATFLLAPATASTHLRIYQQRPSPR